MVRRLCSALIGLAESVSVRRTAVQCYLDHLDLLVERHIVDAQDQQTAMQEGRQGLGLSRKRKTKPAA